MSSPGTYYPNYGKGYARNEHSKYSGETYPAAEPEPLLKQIQRIGNAMNTHLDHLSQVILVEKNEIMRTLPSPYITALLGTGMIATCPYFLTPERQIDLSMSIGVAAAIALANQATDIKKIGLFSAGLIATYLCYSPFESK